jgi:acyl-CoA hydrolase
VLSDLMGPPDANVHGTVFGGKVLAMVDKAAAVAAMRHAGRLCVTVAMDRVEFLVPIEVGDVLVVEAQVNGVGRSSVEVGVDVYAEFSGGGPRRHTNSCLVTMVALDDTRRPVPVPPLLAETPDERRRAVEAAARRARR